MSAFIIYLCESKVVKEKMASHKDTNDEHGEQENLFDKWVQHNESYHEEEEQHSVSPVPEEDFVAYVQTQTPTKRKFTEVNSDDENLESSAKRPKLDILQIVSQKEQRLFIMLLMI